MYRREKKLIIDLILWKIFFLESGQGYGTFSKDFVVGS